LVSQSGLVLLGDSGRNGLLRRGRESPAAKKIEQPPEGFTTLNPPRNGGGQLLAARRDRRLTGCFRLIDGIV
jgi:hypothetical protein